MDLVRGNGRSVVKEDNLKIRKLQTTQGGSGQPPVSFSDFAKADDRFMLRLWISVIDKIISKPTVKENKKNPEDKNILAKGLRQKIGAAALGGKIVRAGGTEFARQWNWKINARSATNQNKAFPKGRWYQAFLGNTELHDLHEERIIELVHEINKHIHEAAKSINGKDKIKSDSNGLLQDMLAAIEKNTLKTAYDKHFPEGKEKQPNFTEKDWEDYCEKANQIEGGDFVKSLNAAILKGADVNAEVKPYYQAIEYLRHIIWKKVFIDEKGTVLGRKEAAEQMPKLLAVHDAIKEFYKKTLKKRSNIATHNVAKKIGAKGKNSGDQIKVAIEKKLEHILPNSANKLKWLCCKKHENIDVNHYIRLGKILHYEASRNNNEDKNIKGGQDTTAAIIAYWKKAGDKLPNSFYWSSKGQMQIKQNEAFVRVWRRALAFANRTLKDWADPDSKAQGDMTIGDTWRDIRKEYGWSVKKEERNPDKAKAYFEGAFLQHYELLFGGLHKKGEVIENIEKGLKQEDKERILSRLRNHIVAMRAAVFHFKGMKTFIQSLINQNEKGKEEVKTPDYVKNFYTADCMFYRQKPVKIMQGALFEQYFKHEQIEGILAEVQKHDAVSVLPVGEQSDDGQSLPLPTLKRILKRVKTAWGESALPAYDAAAKRNEKAEESVKGEEPPEDKKEREEEAAKHAQYIAIKMLYEKPFRAWLADMPADKINGFIDKAVQRATEGAQKICGSKEGEFKELITARAAALPRLKGDEKIDRFFFNLTAATASEMRVQKDYQSDGEKAKEQAEYIENLKCDVIVLALEAYLQEKFSYLAKGKSPLEELPQERQDIVWEKILKEYAQNIDTNGRTFEPWLYFLLHLIPVEEVGSLRQQIRKWQITVGKTENTDKKETEQRIEAAKVRPLLQVLDLYIELHDEQFNTGEQQRPLYPEEKKQFASYYEEKIYDIFKEQIQQDKEQKEKLQAVRGLREMRRFGNEVLDNILQEKGHKVSKDAVATWKNIDIAAAQKTRKELHAEWVKAKGKVGEEWWYKTGKGRDIKYILGEKGKQYISALQEIIKHKEAVAQVELQNHLNLHKLLMTVLGRLVDFSGLFERDLYFTMLALFYENKVDKLEEQFADTKSVARTEIARESEQLIGSFLEQGRIPEAFVEKLNNNIVKDGLKKIFNLTAVMGKRETKQEQYNSLSELDVRMWIRNRFAHLAVLEGQRDSENGSLKFDVDLTREINFARALMSYDRKLKNAVSLSIKDALKKNKLEINWNMGKGETDKPEESHVETAYDKVKTKSKHYLFGAAAETRSIYHLGQKNNFWERPEQHKNNSKDKGNQKQEDKNLGKVFEENLQSKEYVSMVQMLFGGGEEQKNNEIRDKKTKRSGENIGIVKFFNTERGFGFIVPDNGAPDIFVHISTVQAAGLLKLEKGQKVSFMIEPNPHGKGPEAIKLKLLS